MMEVMLVRLAVACGNEHSDLPGLLLCEPVAALSAAGVASCVAVEQGCSGGNSGRAAGMTSSMDVLPA